MPHTNRKRRQMARMASGGFLSGARDAELGARLLADGKPALPGGMLVVRNTFIHYQEQDEDTPHRRPRASSAPPPSPPPARPAVPRTPSRVPRVEPQAPPDAELRTTVQLRNLPYLLTRDMLVELLNSHGWRGQFDLVYLPIDFRTNQSFGYGFVNLESGEAALRFFRFFEGFQAWPMKSSKACSVCWSSNQGLQYNIKVYRNLQIMKEAGAPEAWKPALFKHGGRVAFPAPTRRNKHCGKQRCGAVGAAPRLREARGGGGQ